MANRTRNLVLRVPVTACRRKEQAYSEYDKLKKQLREYKNALRSAGGEAVFVPIRTGLALHEYFKGAVSASGKVQSGSASFPDLDRKNAVDSFKICGVGV